MRAGSVLYRDPIEGSPMGKGPTIIRLLDNEGLTFNMLKRANQPTDPTLVYNRNPDKQFDKRFRELSKKEMVKMRLKGEL